MVPHIQKKTRRGFALRPKTRWPFRGDTAGDVVFFCFVLDGRCGDRQKITPQKTFPGGRTEHIPERGRGIPA